MVVERSFHLSQFSEATTTTENIAWDLIDAEFTSIISPVHNRLSSGEELPIEAASIFAFLLNTHLERHEILPVRPSNRAKPPDLLHRTRRIEKVVKGMKQSLSICWKNHKKSLQVFLMPVEPIIKP